MAEKLIKKLIKLIPLDEKMMNVNHGMIKALTDEMVYEDPSLAGQEKFGQMGSEDKMELLVECLTVY